MPAIRPLERSDLPQVNVLLQEYVPGWSDSGHGAQFIAATLLDHPWADEELPSLVATGEDGEVTGFIGAQARRLSNGDRALRGICCSHLVVAPGHRGGAAGALLLRRLMSGGQDITWSDTANEAVVRMWLAFGGSLDATRTCEWMLVLRSARWFRDLAAARIRRGGPSRRQQAPVPALPFQAAGPRLAKGAFPELAPEVTGEVATAAAIVDALPAIDRRGRLRVAYDEAFLDSLLRLIETSTGALVRRIVYRDRQPIGWYAYVPGPDKVCRVLHLSAFDANGDDVLGELVRHARAEGGAVLAGRLEPHLTGPLRERLAILGFARQPVLHVRDPELRARLLTDSSLLTQLDGEWFVT